MYTVAELETLRSEGRNEEGNDMSSDYCPPACPVLSRYSPDLTWLQCSHFWSNVGRFLSDTYISIGRLGCSRIPWKFIRLSMLGWLDINFPKATV